MPEERELISQSGDAVALTAFQLVQSLLIHMIAVKILTREAAASIIRDGVNSELLSSDVAGDTGATRRLTFWNRSQD